MNKKKVILIHPPTHYLLIPKWTIPLTLLFLRSFLVSKNYDVEILDLADGDENYLEKIPLDAYAYGVTLYTPQDQLAKDMSIYLKEKTNVLLIAGGHHVTYTDKAFLEESKFDVVVRGEGELSFCEVLEGKDLSTIQGITYRESDEIIRNENRPLAKDIDIFPFPKFENFNVKEYPGTFVQKPHSDYRVGTIFSRGCVGECAFCTSVSFWKKKVRFHSYEWIKEYVEYLVDYGVKDLEILDDNFVIHRHFKELCMLFKKHGIKWTCMGISKHITEEKSDIMKQSGCSYVALGIESGSDRLLQSVDNSATIAEHLEAVEILKKCGLPVKGLMMVGLPGTTQEDIDLTVEFIHKTPIDTYGITTFVPFPGTPIWENPEKYGCEIDKSILFADYLIMNKDMNTKSVIKNRGEVSSHRKQILEAMGEKCTIHDAKKRGNVYQENKKREGQKSC